jgi:dipeptidyl aminopeptidase/acylaminoacyl peptidase
MRKYIFLFALCLGYFLTAQAQLDVSYQSPPKDIADLINAPLTPIVSLNPQKTWMAIWERSDLPTIEELAQPELRLAGLRINPRTNGESRSLNYLGLQLKSTDGKTQKTITGMLDKGVIQNMSWSPDGQKIAFTWVQNRGLSLWVAYVSGGQAVQLTDFVVNDAMGGLPLAWLSDSKTILYKSIVESRGDAPTASLTPTGPIVQETAGKKGTIRTYQDLLKNKADEALFDYYCTTQLKSVQIESKQIQNIGKPAVIEDMSPSPDGNYVLISKIQRPYSYLVPSGLFPVVLEVWDKQGNPVKEIANLPLAEDLPKGFDAVRKGVRGLNWRSDKPATLAWIEALDGGNPMLKIGIRDELYSLDAPFTAEKKPLFNTAFRIQGIIWGNDNVAIAYEGWRESRKMIASAFSPTNPADKKVLFDRSTEDRYGNPGSFVTALNAQGKSVLWIDAPNTLYLNGQGASPEGDRPFIDSFDLTTQKAKRLWQSAAPYYESPVALLDAKKGLAIITRESKTESPNYYLKNWKSNKITALTDFKNPYPALEGVEKQVIRYKRKDGVDLQGNLYLPKGWKQGDAPLPVLLWAYPFEFKDAKNAGQVQGSPHQFTRLSWGTPILWVTQGYAVFDNASMPIIGEGTAEPNDKFIEHLVASAEAAVNHLAETKIADRNRVGVGGHSYGAFMTANLLAHSDLFAAGIARSGAYNRTLTPFGFQGEERTYWDAPAVYHEMSPFGFADKVNEPILLIHGEADNNSGTFPIQSERFYSALKGLGKKARYVVLPHEAHGYQAKESVLHMAWEMNQWLEKYVKNAEKDKPMKSPAPSTER